MLRIKPPLLGFVFFSLVASLSADQVVAESTTLIDNSIDALEKALEMERHRQLIDHRASLQTIPSAFTTDGCSGGLSIGWEYLGSQVAHFKRVHGDQPPWQACCITHDRAYHLGGLPENSAEMSFRERKEADEKLLDCVVETGRSRTTQLGDAYDLSPGEVEKLYHGIAHLMYRAVRIGGMPCTGLPWRWGFGWPECE